MEDGPHTTPRNDHLIFYYVDGKDFLKIFDRRDAHHLHVIELNDVERQVLIACLDVVSFQGLQELLPHLPTDQLFTILHAFEQKGIIFAEDNHYLCLPLHNELVRIPLHC